MRLLARGDGASVHFEDAASHLGVQRLVLQQICESLSERGYVEPYNHIVRGVHIALTRRGRDFIIEQGYLH
jgi:hypothetical protein